MSRSLKLTRPSSIRLILDPEARMVYPASSRVTPLASRNLRSWEPRRIRSTVGPLPGCAVITPAPSDRSGNRCAKAASGLPVCRTCTQHFHLHVHPALRLQGIEGMIALVAASARLTAAASVDGNSITSHRAHLAYEPEAI